MNLVEEYLSENKELKLSLRSLSKRLDIRKKEVYYLTHKSKFLRKVNPCEVGSGSSRINVFTAI